MVGGAREGLDQARDGRSGARAPTVHATTAPVHPLLALQRTAGNRALAGFDTATAPTIQRYQAGDEGHGGIEERAFTKIGFSQSEISQIYFGNWLRDFSQLNSTGSPLAPPDLASLYTVVRVLGWGEFNREVTPAELGTYVPSEHLDNPSATGTGPPIAADKQTVEDPAIQALARAYPKGDPRRKPFDDAFSRLSPEQQAAYESEEARRGEITAASKASGLPEYIERGKMHARDKLTEAIRKGRTPEGMQAMGDALHAVEDYFSHSNFVDLAIWTLETEGQPAAHPYAEAMKARLHGVNPALIGGTGPGGVANIVTGTYSPGANDNVSRLELLKAQLHSGEFTRAFVIGAIRLGILTVDEVAKTVGTAVGAAGGGGIGALLGGLYGGLAGMVGGAGSGASSGYDAGARHGYRSGYAQGGGGATGEALGELEGALEGAVGGAEGLVDGALHGLVGGTMSGARDGGREGARLGGAVVGGAARAAADAAGQLILDGAKLDMLIASPIVATMLAPFLLIVDQVIDHLSDKQTDASAAQAKARGIGPTHSQIAKDAPDHPLFGVSSKLASLVDAEIGRAMMAAWAARVAAGVAPGTAVAPADALPVTSLVDKYVSHPTIDPWWRSPLLPLLT